MHRTGQRQPGSHHGDTMLLISQASTGRLLALATAMIITVGPACARTGLDWDIAATENLAAGEKPRVRQTALSILEDHPECGTITSGYRSTAQKGGYYITCISSTTSLPFNLWFTFEDTGGGYRLETPEHYDSAAARQLCHSRIRISVDNPDYLEILYPSSYALREIQNGNTFIIQDFILSPPNAERAIYRARCLVLPDGTVQLTVPERG